MYRFLLVREALPPEEKPQAEAEAAGEATEDAGEAAATAAGASGKKKDKKEKKLRPVPPKKGPLVAVAHFRCVRACVRARGVSFVLVQSGDGAITHRTTD